MATSNLATPHTQDNPVERFWAPFGTSATPQAIERPVTPALHTHDGAGRKFSTPISTEQACRAGIALFE